MRKIKLWFVMVMMCFAAVVILSAEANAAEIASGTCGDNLTWTLTDDGVLSITGTGPMTNPSWSSYKSSITKVIIGDGATNIVHDAFRSCPALTEVVIPGSVETIEYQAFAYCSALTSVEISEGVKKIDYNAFNHCSALTSVVIPGSVETIGSSAFAYCDALASVEICYGVAEIEDWAFYDDQKLTSLVIPGSVKTIGKDAFGYCNTLESLEICNGVETIGNNAFEYCWALTSVEIPDSVTSIGDRAFEFCWALTTAEIPAGVTSIGTNPFVDCAALVSITVSAENPNYCSVDGVLFDKNMTRLISYPASKTDTAYQVPASVTKIDYSAFSRCVSLESVEIGDGVLEIGEWQFFGCSLLSSINVSAGNPNFCSVDGVLFDKNMTTLIRYPGCIEETAYFIPDGVTSIHARAFSGCYRLVNIVLPDGMTHIANMAFVNCINLTSIVIPDSVTSIGESVALACWKLATIHFTGSEEQWDAIVVGSNNDLLKTATVVFHSELSIGVSSITTFTNVKTGKPRLTLTAADFAESYEIWRAETENGEYTLIDTLEKTTSGQLIYIDASAEAGKTYYYKVRATGGGRIGEFSESVSCACIIVIPTLTGAVDTETCKPVLTWTEITGTKSYEIWRSDAEDGQFEKIGDTVDLTYTDETAEAGKTYFYKVRSTADPVQREFSAIVSVTCMSAEELLEGLNKDSDGVWRYYEDGEVAIAFTGFVKHINGKYYFVDKGVVKKSTGLVLHVNGKWYYIQNGVKSDYTGFVKHTDGKYYYVKNGVKSDTNGFLKHTNDKYYYVQNGMMVDTTGLVKHTNGKYYYIVKGVKQDDFTGLVKHTNGKYYYVLNGMMQDSYTGLAKHTNKKYYYVQKGVWTKVTALVPHTNGKLYYVVDGIHDNTYNGTAKDLNGKEYKVVKGIAQP